MINPELKTLCERIARLEEERKTIAADILEVKKEAESAGFDKKLVAKTVRMMGLDETKRRAEMDQHDLFETYLEGVGLRIGSMKEAA